MLRRNPLYLRQDRFDLLTQPFGRWLPIRMRRPNHRNGRDGNSVPSESWLIQRFCCPCAGHIP